MDIKDKDKKKPMTAEELSKMQYDQRNGLGIYKKDPKLPPINPYAGWQGIR